jgi:mRNA interferase HigB
MRLTGKKVLTKLKRKNMGNVKLRKAIDDLIDELEKSEFTSFESLKAVRKDADKVHNDGFYFFDIDVHRSMILIEFGDGGEATAVWAGTHNEYETTFKNNKMVVEKWLRNHGWIK